MAGLAEFPGFRYTRYACTPNFKDDMEAAIALLALTAMEIVLGIDNIVFIAVLTGRLPREQQSSARRLGLGLALISRLMLLSVLSWLLHLETPLFELSSLGIPLPSSLSEEARAEINGVSWRDVILLAGGLFLIRKSVKEIHAKVLGEDEHGEGQAKISFTGVLVQIAVLDIVFSLDSVITAVGMVDRSHLWVMITAVILAVLVMLTFANQISDFVNHNPTLKVLALSFLILIGVLLVADAVGTKFNKGYVYFAMAFSLVVELLNLRVRRHPA